MIMDLTLFTLSDFARTLTLDPGYGLQIMRVMWWFKWHRIVFIVTFKLITINAMGFSSRKAQLILDYAGRGKFDLCFVQATMVSDSNSIKSLSARWPGVSLWAPALGRKRGVAVFISPDFEGKIASWQKDSEGRIISMLIRYQNIDYNVVNIYSPTNVSERKSFLENVHKYFFPHSKLIMGGDFNCYDNERDKFGGNCTVSKEFSDFKSCFRLTDAWRVKHLHVSQCTWFNSDFSIGSQLDTFLISRDISPGITSCEIRPCVYWDHDFVAFELDCNDGNRHGPGIWKFNNSLLEDDNYCVFIQPIIEQHLSFKHVFISIKEFWESLKTTIKDETVKVPINPKILFGLNKSLYNSEQNGAKSFDFGQNRNFL